MTSSLVQLITGAAVVTFRVLVLGVGRSTGEVTPQVTPQVEALVRLLAARDALSNAEIRAELRLKDRVHVQHSYIAPALDRGLVEMTIPDKPQSRLQKYRLTESGRAVLAKEEASR